MNTMVIMPEMPADLASPTLAAAWRLRAEANQLEMPPLRRQDAAAEPC